MSNEREDSCLAQLSLTTTLAQRASPPTSTYVVSVLNLSIRVSPNTPLRLGRCCKASAGTTSIKFSTFSQTPSGTLAYINSPILASTTAQTTNAPACPTFSRNPLTFTLLPPLHPLHPQLHPPLTTSLMTDPRDANYNSPPDHPTHTICSTHSPASIPQSLNPAPTQKITDAIVGTPCWMSTSPQRPYPPSSK